MTTKNETSPYRLGDIKTIELLRAALWQVSLSTGSGARPDQCSPEWQDNEGTYETSCALAERLRVAIEEHLLSIDRGDVSVFDLPRDAFRGPISGRLGQALDMAEDRMDVRDSDRGPVPDDWMQVATTLQAAIAELHVGRPTARNSNGSGRTRIESHRIVVKNALVDGEMRFERQPGMFVRVPASAFVPIDGVTPRVNLWGEIVSGPFAGLAGLCVEIFGTSSGTPDVAMIRTGDPDAWREFNAKRD